MHAQRSDPYLEMNGVRLRYRDEGRGRAVLLVHGWTLDLDMWGEQAAALAAEFRVVRLDRRGFGLSSGLPSPAGDQADVLALCEHLGLDSVALVGMSQGAGVVLEFARSHPRMISCIVLDGPPQLAALDGLGSPDIPYTYYRELAQTHGVEAFRREWSGHALARLRTPNPETRALLARMIARYRGGDLSDREALAGGPQSPGFESVDRPVLVINGEFDLESRKRFARQLSELLPEVEHAEIPDAGHLCNLTIRAPIPRRCGDFSSGTHFLPSLTEVCPMRGREDISMKLLPTTIVGSYPQPEWLIDRARLAGRFPPRVRARELWRVAPEFLQEAQDDATIMAIKAQEDAGIDIVTDGEMRRESYSNRFATALEGVDIDNPGHGARPERSPQSGPASGRDNPAQTRRGSRGCEVLAAAHHRSIKISIPGPFTMAQQAQIDFYGGSREAAAMDYATALNEEIRDLFSAGADVVQVDEPYMQARPEQARVWGLRALNRASGRHRRHDRGTYLLRLCRHHSYAAQRLFVPARAAAVLVPSDLDRDGAVKARLLGACLLGGQENHARRDRLIGHAGRNSGTGGQPYSPGAPVRRRSKHHRVHRLRYEVSAAGRRGRQDEGHGRGCSHRAQGACGWIVSRRSAQPRCRVGSLERRRRADQVT